jgi:hypothetical protein
VAQGPRSSSGAAQARKGLPQDFGVWSAFPFAGLNQSASRIAIDDREFYWLENYLKVGDGYLRTLWDCGTAIYTAPSGKTIIYFFWFNIGAQEYVAIFLSDGSAVQVAYPSLAQTTISATPNLFYNVATGQLPVCCQSGTQYLLIANHNTENDYWLWDGTILYQAGSIGPTDTATITDGGSGYTSVPSYTVYGGSGSGVVLTPVIANGSVVSLTVDNPGTGYLPGEIVQVAFSGGGTDTTPILEAVISAGNVGYLTLVAGGSSYTDGTFALAFSGGGGTGAAGIFTVAGGVVISVQLTAGGTGYTSTPTISFAASSGGSGAAAVAGLSPGSVTSITIVNGGTNLTGSPVLTIVGGGGTGAEAAATVSGGVITAVSVSNGGSGYTSTPAVEVQVGLNNAAAAILQLMPFGVSGTSIETYQSRVWISYPNQQGKENNGGTFFVSAPGSLTDFATSDGGDIFTNTDRFLRSQYTFLRQTSNFLYAIGDSSASVISNVQTGGSPTSTTFSYQNVDPQIGSSWRDTAQDYSNSILFGNPLGIYGLYGGSVRKVTPKLDRIFSSYVSPANGGLTPSSAVANVYAQLVFVMLMTITDPFTFKARNVMVGWDGKQPFIASQTPGLTFIGTQEIGSNPQAWGTDGASLYPLFNTPSSLPKIISTKIYGATRPFMVNSLHSLYLDAEDVSAGQNGLAFAGSVDVDGLAVPAENSVTGATLSCPTGSVPIEDTLRFVAPKGSGAVYGCGVGAGLPQVFGPGMGITLASSSHDFNLRNLALGYIEWMGVA